MIDWVTARVPIASARSLNTGSISSVDADGILEWMAARRVIVHGSHATTVTVKKYGNGEVEIAGSPAKFLQGHNIFGSDDLRGLASAMILGACSKLGLELSDEELSCVRAGEYALLRVDLNFSFAMGSRTKALAWIEQAAAVGTLQNRGRGKRRSSTVTWGEGSRQWKLKAYSKGAEIGAPGPRHRLPDDLPMRTGLSEWADDKLRIEVEIHSRELKKRGLGRAAAWRTGDALELYRKYLAKLHLGGYLTLSPDAVRALPLTLRTTYALWVRGVPLLELMSPAKYYRHRAELLKQGINIAVPPTPTESATIPLRGYLETPCLEIPAWAEGNGLYWAQPTDNHMVMGDPGSITVRRRSGVTRTIAGAEPNSLRQLPAVGRLESRGDRPSVKSGAVIA